MKQLTCTHFLMHIQEENIQYQGRYNISHLILKHVAYDIGQDTATIYIITSPILVHNFSIPQLPIPPSRTSNIPIFQNIDNLAVICLFIDESNESTII